MTRWSLLTLAFSTSSHTAYNQYQLREVVNVVATVPQDKRLSQAFLMRYEKYYNDEFRHGYDKLKDGMRCVENPNENECNVYLQRSFDEGVRGQFPHMHVKHEQEHNAHVQTTIDTLNVLGRMRPDK